MTKNLAFGLMRHGIRVNQVNPGWMETASEHRTQIQQDGAPENWLHVAAPQRPMGRYVQPWGSGERDRLLPVAGVRD